MEFEYNLKLNLSWQTPLVKPLTRRGEQGFGTVGVQLRDIQYIMFYQGDQLSSEFLSWDTPMFSEEL